MLPVQEEVLKVSEAHAFENMTDLEEIVIPSTVENAELSFFGCIRLKKLIVEPSTNPDAIRNISDNGFWHCMSIDKNKFDISGINGRIGEKAFYHFSFDVEELDFYCSELGEYVIALSDIKKVTFHKDCKLLAQGLDGNGIGHQIVEIIRGHGGQHGIALFLKYAVISAERVFPCVPKDSTFRFFCKKITPASA